MELCIDKMAQDVADKVLDEVEYNGKTLRQWVNVISKAQWISVKDKLPEKSMLVLGVVHGHVGELAYIASRNIFERRERPIDGVTHWQPLPDPPKDKR